MPARDEPSFALTLAALDVLPFLPQLALLVAAAATVGYVCQRLRIVPIVGFLLAGALVGPFGPLARLLPDQSVLAVRDMELVATLADYGVVLLLFTIGLEFSLSRLAAIKGLIFGSGGLQVAGTILVVTLVLAPFIDWRAAVFTGCLVSLSSTAIVLKLLGDDAQTATPLGQASLGILIFQDLAVVAMVILVPMLAPAAAGGATGGGADAVSIYWALGKAGLIIGAVLLLARRIVPLLMDFVARTCRGEIFLLSVLAVCALTAWATSAAGVSAALGAFLGGLVVSESKFHHHAYGEIMPLQIVFSAVFFVSVGMLLDLGFLAVNLPLVLGIVLVVIAIKSLVTAGSLLALGRAWPLALGVGLTLGQVGEFGFVLARIGEDAGLAPLGMARRGFQTFISATVILMLVTPLLKSIGARLAARRAAFPPGDGETNDATDLSGHVVIDGWGPAGRLLAEALRKANVPHIVVTLNPGGAEEAERVGHRVVRGATGRRASLERAGAARAAAVVVADDDADTTRRAVAIARELAAAADQPVRILARIAEHDARDSVRRAGADFVIDSHEASAAPLLREALLATGRDIAGAEDAQDDLLDEHN